MKTQVNSLKTSSFSEILKPYIVWQFVRQLVRSVFDYNLVLYLSTLSWLRLQQEAKWVNINFERRELTSAKRGYPTPDDFGELLLWTTTVIYTKVLSLVKKLQRQ